MKNLRPIVLVAALVALCLPGRAADRKSPHDTITADIAGDHLTLSYGRPYSKSPKTGEIRTIWGKLVPWDKPYRLGADEATQLKTEKALTFGGTVIPAGTYTLYQIPSAAGASKLAFSSAIDKWGVPVDVDHDVARVDLAKGPLAPQLDQLTIVIEADASTGGGVLKIEWETTVFSAPFTVAK